MKFLGLLRAGFGKCLDPLMDAIYRWMLPEIRELEPETRRDVLGTLRRHPKAEGTFAELLLFAVGWTVWGPDLTRALGFPIWLGVIPLTAFLLLASFVTRHLARLQLRPVLWQFMNERGIPTCLSCGYDLRGQIERRCPECGTAF